MGFTLRITNAPAGTYWWLADFYENTFEYDPPAASEGLRPNEVWNYPSDPRGCTTLHIAFFDVEPKLLSDVFNLGPVNDGKDYVYNCSTGVLSEVVAPEILHCEITITAPDSAGEGEKVSVSALLKNVSRISIMYKTEIWAVPDLFPAFRIGTIEKNINSGSTFTVYGSFTMPASNTTIQIWVERWATDHWVYDYSAVKAISLGVVPGYRGAISRKELDYDGARSIIPVY